MADDVPTFHKKISLSVMPKHMPALAPFCTRPSSRNPSHFSKIATLEILFMGEKECGPRPQSPAFDAPYYDSAVFEFIDVLDAVDG